MIIVVGRDKEHEANAKKLAQAISQPSTSSISTASAASSSSSFSVATSASPEVATEETTGGFDELDLSALQDARVTFIGHGTTIRFGSNSNKDEEHPGYTPQEFVAELKTRGLSPAVRTIDLFACNVGLTDESGKSYASEVAALLKQDPQYKYIQLRAFTVNASAYSREIISVDKETGKAYVFGVKKENESAYQEKHEEVAAIKKHVDLIGKEIKKKEKMVNNNNYPRHKKNLEIRITDLKNQSAEFVQKLEAARKARFSLRKELASYDNYREALDNKPEYHIQPYDPQANTSSKKRSHSPSLQPTEGKSEEVSSTDVALSPDHKQAKVEGAPFQVPVEQCERATAALASSSLNPSTQDVVEYSLESAAPRDPRGDPRAKDRQYTQKTAALGEQIRRSYYSITATSKENSSLTASSNQTDSENNPANDPGAHASPSFKPR